MKTQYIDSHAHVQFSAYDQDRREVISRAHEADVQMVNVGTQYSTSEAGITLARENPGEMWATVGFHPGHTDSDSHHDPWEISEKQQEQFDYATFLELARSPEVVAIGECGLDYYRADRGQGIADRVRDQQIKIFQQQIELAKEVRKPLVIHCRKAFSDLIEILNSELRILHSPAGVVHFFSGSLDEARQLIDLGFSLGFGGVITFARDYDEVVKNIPLDRMLLETDAPYVAPVPYRGKRNEPAYIIETTKKIAELRTETLEKVAEATTENAKKLLGI